MATTNRREGALILVAEGEDAVRNVLVQALLDEGFDVEAARSAGEALDLMERRVPGLVVLDLTLPPRGGLEVLDGMHRRANALNAVPVIVLSEMQVRLPRGLARIVAQLRKPVNLDVLAQKASAAVRLAAGA